MNNFNWYEYTIDTPFLQKHKHNLVLVIGDKDTLISVDKTSFAITSISILIDRSESTDPIGGIRTTDHH